ncbi:hypothetical protein FUAX_52510 (plasmid) [Fulvitalea axinellae]|uniref:Uncharacterized protein n=1 Tax=Fulvitalea axinellae TaxID=1182444 RepID=A0AAU9D2L4_9BACT|nr:hypothetical protein FUAX_52510 [Fulvitalea axinellae]
MRILLIILLLEIPLVFGSASESRANDKVSYSAHLPASAQERDRIQTYRNGEIEIRGKSVVFIYKDRIIDEEDIPVQQSDYYPVRFYLLDMGEINGIDYVFLVEDSHEVRDSFPEENDATLIKLVKEYRAKSI